MRHLSIQRWFSSSSPILSKSETSSSFEAFKELRVALVGRPNVGKSTLFNRLAGKRMSMTSNLPGLTRDRIEADARLYDLQFKIFDTPGVDEASLNKAAMKAKKKVIQETPNLNVFDNMLELQNEMAYQSSLAVQQADVTIFMVDGAHGIDADDAVLARWIGKHRREGLIKNKKILLVANKCDSSRKSTALSWSNVWNPDDGVGEWDDVFKLGLGEPICISAEHGEGLDDLYHKLKQLFTEIAQEERTQDPLTLPTDAPSILQLAVVGRPNTGKSTLINTILGDKRLLVGPKPGVTRDCVSHSIEWKSHQINLMDTAGLQGVSEGDRGKVGEIDAMAMASSLKAIRFANVVALTVDASVSVLGNLHYSKNSYEILLPRREKQIGQFVIDEGRALMIVVTKWDVVPKDQRNDVLETLQKQWENVLPRAKGLFIIPVSSVEGYNITKIFEKAVRLHEMWNRRISTGLLNRWVGEMKNFHLPHMRSKRKSRGKKFPKIKYVTQIKSRPPTFVIFGSNVNEKAQFMQFLLNSLRQEFDLFGIPLRILSRSAENPFVKK